VSAVYLNTVEWKMVVGEYDEGEKRLHIRAGVTPFCSINRCQHAPTTQPATALASSIGLACSAFPSSI